MSGDAILAGRVQANMLMASRAARDFITTRDAEHRKAYDERFEAALSFASKAQSSMVDARRGDLSKQLVKKLQDYQNANQAVFDLMQRRDQILTNDLNPRGIKMQGTLSEIMDTAYQDKDPEAAYLAGRALEHVLLGRLYLFKFLDANEAESVDRVRAELASGFEDDFDNIVAAIEDENRQTLLSQFSDARDGYVSKPVKSKLMLAEIARVIQSLG